MTMPLFLWRKILLHPQGRVAFGRVKPLNEDLKKGVKDRP